MITKAAFLNFLLVLVCVVPSPLKGEVTVAAGNWSSPSIWQSGVVPGNGQNVVINHAVDLDIDTVVGTSPSGASTPAVQVSASGALTVRPFKTLTVRGDVVLNNSSLTLGEGSTFQFDSSAAQTPTSYIFQIGTAHNQLNARLRIYGTAEHRAIFRSALGSARARISDGAFLQGGMISASFADIERLGDGQFPAITTSNTSASIFDLNSVLFSECGPLVTRYAISDSAIFSIQNVTWRNSFTSYNMQLNGYTLPGPSGIREIANSVFDGVVRFYPGTGFIINNNLFLNGFDVNQGAWALFDGNFIRMVTGPRRVPASTSNNYWLVDNSTLVNPHFVQALSYPQNTSITGEIFEFTGSDGNGDCVLVGQPSSPATLTLKNNIVLPNAIGENSGTLFSALGSANTTIIAEHNTYFVGRQGAAVGETYSGFPGMLQSFRSNLAWDTSPRGYKLFDSGLDENVPDLVSSQNLDYNFGFNILAGSLGRGYNRLEFSAGQAGQHDLEVDPSFYDPTRDLSRWDLSLGGPGTVVNALLELSKRNDLAGYNPAYNIEALINYVRQGFVPQNTLLKGAAHDGTDIGAMPVAQLAPTPSLTPTPTFTITRSPVPTFSTPTLTPSPSATLIPTGTATTVIIFSPTITATATSIPSVTPSSLPTPTRTKKPKRTRPN